MAMYEDRGYCPYNDFSSYDVNDKRKVSEHWKTTNNMLGTRLAYMVYSKSGNSYKGCYIVDALKYANGILGIQVATALQTLIPKCEYGKDDFPIVCTDVINPYQIPASIQELDGRWVLSSQVDQNIALYEDERYLIAIQKAEKEVHIYLYKK